MAKKTEKSFTKGQVVKAHGRLGTVIDTRPGEVYVSLNHRAYRHWYNVRYVTAVNSHSPVSQNETEKAMLRFLEEKPRHESIYAPSGIAILEKLQKRGFCQRDGAGYWSVKLNACLK